MEAEVYINQNKFVWKSNELDSVIFKKDVESDLVKIWIIDSFYQDKNGQPCYSVLSHYRNRL